MPIYNLATREDHIAPARSVFFGSSFFGGKVTFVLTGSGHIAGVINPPARKKYQYWTGPAPKGDSFEAWLKNGQGAPRLVVAALAGLDRGASTTTPRQGPEGRRRQAQADRGGARQLRQGEGVSIAIIGLGRMGRGRRPSPTPLPARQ